MQYTKSEAQAYAKAHFTGVWAVQSTQQVQQGAFA